MEKNQFQESLKVVESFLLNSTAEINYVGFFISIFFSALLAYLVKLTFIKVSRTLNDRDYFSDIFDNCFSIFDFFSSRTYFTYYSAFYSKF